jgi:tRNA uridine 5-carboxymethylaminomethyl modification enzyme
MLDKVKKNHFDCIVIGAGHAGVEAAYAAAVIGAKTALITIRKDKIAEMSCNPAIGGLAKGQIAREVDALGGLMGLATDATGIQFRLLNRSKGPAVRSPRAQTDRHKYAGWMRRALEQTDNLDIIENTVARLIVEQNAVRAVVCADGKIYKTRTVIITTGTFLSGLIHIGPEQIRGGRIGEPASYDLAQSLRSLGLHLSRLKTGTSPRLDASTVELDRLEVQPGDERPACFSFLTRTIDTQQIPCWITYTNEKIHKLLKDNIDRAPLYTGQIKSIGPRYCPSIETKVIRFADKDRHQVFLEPEEQDIRTIYCNGISTSYPKDIQQQMLRLLPGTENARIIRYGYAIEYDYCPPIQLQSNLESKKIEGLFLAGQINGTSGYEEAAAQGIIAGINAARKLQGTEPIVLGRDQAYIGVLVDDLLTKEIDEPYRMFTSRAEFRLSLRADNADRRLTPVGRAVGLVDDGRWAKFTNKLRQIELLTDYLKNTSCQSGCLWDRLRRPSDTAMQELKTDPYVRANGFSDEVIESAAVDAKYEGYLAKQEKLVAGLKNLDKKRIPAELDYHSIVHLRAEAVEKLSAFRPATLGQASRIAGVTPADITVIQVHLRKHY